MLVCCADSVYERLLSDLGPKVLPYVILDCKPRSILGCCLSHHSQSWCLCADGNPLYHTSPSNSTPYPSVIAMNNTQARKGFVSYAIAAMRHFKGRGVVWELW